jgi:hypothetical protein
MLYAPNFANYRLGPLLGSECDPLTTNSLLVQKELKKSVDVFPNPNHGILNIKVNNTSNKENKICIHNALGQVVYSQVNLENQLQLNMLELQLKSGIYWVTVEAENQLLRKKFVFSK